MYTSAYGRSPGWIGYLALSNRAWISISLIINGATPLYRQAILGRDTVKLLCELGADIEKPNNYGDTPLHMQLNFFILEQSNFLIDKGANVNAKNDMGRTPLASVLMVCRGIYIAQTAEIASMLLEAGAKENLIKWR